MSAEVATVSALWKPLAWVFGGLLAVIKLFIGYIWVRHQKDVEKLGDENSSLKKKVSEMELNLNKNYYDKEEISRHIVEPIREDMRETNATLKSLMTFLGDMQQDVAILKHEILRESLERHRNDTGN